MRTLLRNHPNWFVSCVIALAVTATFSALCCACASTGTTEAVRGAWAAVDEQWEAAGLDGVYSPEEMAEHNRLFQEALAQSKEGAEKINWPQTIVSILLGLVTGVPAAVTVTNTIRNRTRAADIDTAKADVKNAVIEREEILWGTPAHPKPTGKAVAPPRVHKARVTSKKKARRRWKAA